MSFLNNLLKNSTFKNLVIYILIGGFAFIIDYTVFILTFEYFGINEYIANLIAMNVGAIFSFSFNAFLNFKKTDKLLKRFFSYYIVIVIGMGISTFILSLWGKENIQIGKIVAMAIVSCFQFIFNKIFTFNY